MDWVSALSRRSCGVAKSETDSSLLRRDYLREIAITQVKDKTAQSIWIEPDCVELVDD
jgi:hypothetical protein